MTELTLTKEEDLILAKREESYKKQQYQLLRMSILQTLLPKYVTWYLKNGEYEPSPSVFWNNFYAEEFIPSELDRELISNGEIHTTFQMLWVESKKIVTERT